MRTTRRQGMRAVARRGSILPMVAVLVTSMAFLSLALVMIISSSNREQRQARESLSAFYVCETGLSDAVFELAIGGDGDVGSKVTPITLGSSTYWVEATDLGLGMTSLTSTGSVGRSQTRLELIVRPKSANFYRWAAFGEETVTMDSNAWVDSYDSTLGSYEDQAVNGSGSNSWANDDGDIGSNADITLSSNSGIYGDALPGTTSTVTLEGDRTFVTGSIAPAAETTDLPPITVPYVPLLESGELTNGTTVLPGVYGYTDLQVHGNVTIIGPATLVVENFDLLSNSKITVDASGGRVQLYVLNDFVVGSNTVIAATDYDPSAVEIKLLTDNVIDPTTDVDIANVRLRSNSKIYGAIYAPNASIDINSNFEMFGSLVAREVHLDSYAKIHFDENMLWKPSSISSSTAFETVCWRILPNP